MPTEENASPRPLPLRTELAWGSGDPVTVKCLMTSFLLGQKLIYQFPSTLWDLTYWYTQRILSEDLGFVFGFWHWRMDSLLSTHEAAFASLCCIFPLP